MLISDNFPLLLHIKSLKHPTIIYYYGKKKERTQDTISKRDFWPR